MWRTRLCALLATVVVGVIPLHAGFIKVWQLNETETAPVLVTGQVIAVHQGERAVKESAAWNHETWQMTADIRVLRSYSRSGKPLPFGELQLTFYAYHPPLRMMNGSTVPLPRVEPGETVILPLQENDDPSSPWKLTADQGVNATLPARDELTETEPPPATARAFLLREIANALANGTPKEVFAASSYLQTQDRGVAPELLPLIESQVSDNRDRWAEIATSTVASTGIPRPAFADLFKPEGIPPERPGSQSLAIAQAALGQLKPSPETDALLIRTLIADAPVHAWGSANSLLEFGDHPVLNETLRQALKDDVSGTSYIALTLARNGHKALLPEALNRALRVCDRPAADLDHTDLQGAAALLRDFGNDRQLDQLAGLVRKYQTHDRNFYNLLWQYSTEVGNPREARVLSVVLNDRQPLYEGMTVCDFAVGVLERATGEHFGSVAAARAWLDARHIPR